MRIIENCVLILKIKMSQSIEIRLKKTNKTFHEGDIIKGSVVINSLGEEKIEGLALTLEGFV